MDSQVTISTDSVHAFVDTNFFLQLRVPDQLDWSLLGHCGEVVLLVPTAVQREVQRLKSDGNSRRSRRARDAASLLMRIATSSGKLVLLKDSPIRVLMALPAHQRRGDSSQPDLNPDHPDDAILIEVLQYSRAREGARVLLITSDSDQVVACDRFQIECFVPPEEWRLPPEQDEQGKRFRQMEDRIAKLEKAEPQITVSWCRPDESAITELVLNVVEYDEPSKEEIDQLMKDVAQWCPAPQRSIREMPPGHADPFFRAMERAGMGKLVPPTEEEVSYYYEQAHAKWLKDLRDSIQKFPRRMSMPSRRIEVLAFVRNEGIRPAEGTIVRFTACGAIMIDPDHDEELSQAPDYLPEPPRKPEGRWKDSSTGRVLRSGFGLPNYSQVQRVGASLAPIRRDPYGFYWYEGNSNHPASVRAYECKEFRHGSHFERFRLTISLPPCTPSDSFALKCSVSASNLSLEFSGILPVKVVTQSASSIEAIRAKLVRMTGAHGTR